MMAVKEMNGCSLERGCTRLLIWAPFARAVGARRKPALQEKPTMKRPIVTGRSCAALAGWLLLILLGFGFQGEKVFAETKEEQAAKPMGGASANRLVRDGLVVEFSAKAAPDEGEVAAEPMQGGFVDVAFRITDSQNGKPVQGLYPAAWMDIGKPWSAKGSERAIDCKERVGMYLQGSVGIRPMIDLNSYFVLVMNQDATITVIDPLVGITGITKLYALINLKKPGADWAKTRDEKRLFVTMPQAGQVARVDLDTFKVTANVEAGKHPVRIAVQPDEKYLWIGNDSENTEESGVTVLDAATLAVARFIPTGKGHHEIAFSADSRYAFVTNRRSGNLSVIDVHSLKKIKDLQTGPLPISLAFSPLSQMLYVADGETGKISVLDGKSHTRVTVIDAKPGLGPLRFSPDGRWGMVVNSSENIVNVIDASTNRIAHTLAVGEKPFQVSFSRAFAYVRSLGTERVSMIELQHLDKSGKPPVVNVAIGSVAPGKVKDVSVADGIKEAAGEAAVLVVSPGDFTVYYYMEGMNAPMGNFRNYGRLPRAVEVANRTLREEEPGKYAGKVRLPAAGTYDVAFLLDSPRILHCFQVTAKPNPKLGREGPALAVKYLQEERKVAAGATVRFKFRLKDPETDQPREGLTDVGVLYYLAPGRMRTEVRAKEVESGVYEAELPLPTSGAYFIYVGSPSAKVRYSDLPYFTMQAVRQVARTRVAAEGEKQTEAIKP